MVRLFNAAGMTPCRGKNSADHQRMGLRRSSERSPAAAGGGGLLEGSGRFRLSAWLGPAGGKRRNGTRRATVGSLRPSPQRRLLV